MRMVTCGRLGLVVLAVVCAAASAAAQAPKQEMVPREFVETLAVGLPFGDHAQPEVLVGRIPESLARLVPLPHDSRVVGSLVYSRYSMSAVAVAGAPAAVREEWTERLRAAGWRKYEEPPRRGFESNAIGDSYQFCMGDSITLNLGVSKNPRGGSYVRLIPLHAREYSVCRAPVQPVSDRPESLIPSLTPPRGSISQGGGSGGGGDAWDARARLRTELTAEQLVEHYGSQLRGHGWEPLERLAAPGVAVETFRVKDPEGAIWNGILTASAPATEADRILSLRVTRVERIF